MRADNERLSGAVDSLKRGLATIVGDPPPLRQAVELARKVAATDSTVLLRGESGTGKDLFARAIHFSSRRAAGPWVKVNCGALPENLLESELFGHEKGAFTGAVRQKPGRFEDANRGTLFLDEIGELPMALQVKLLQVIEEKTFTRVGGNQPVTVDVRIIAATNRDLEEMARERQFREDLFFRLNVFPIRLPPLRERLGRRARRWSSSSCAATAPRRTSSRPRRCARSSATVSRQRARAGAHARARADPGRQRPDRTSSTCRSRGRSCSAPREPGAGASWVPEIPPEGLSLEVLERELILQALERARGNKSQAARLLGLTRRTLYSRMERHGLRKPGEGGGGGRRGETSAGGRREPAGARRSVSLLRGILFDNLGLKLVALLLAVVVYLNVYTERPATMVVSFPIQITDLADSLSLSGPAGRGPGRAAGHGQAAHPAAGSPSRASRSRSPGSVRGA